MTRVLSVAVLVTAAVLTGSASAAPRKKAPPKKPAVTQAESDFSNVDRALEATMDGEPSSTSAKRTSTASSTPAPAPTSTSTSTSTSTTSTSTSTNEPDRSGGEDDAKEHLFSLSLDSGIAMVAQQFHSNAAPQPGRLAGYDYSAGGLGARLSARYAVPVGSTLRLGLVGFYQYAGATGVDATTYDRLGGKSTAQLSLESHHGAIAATGGVHANVLGGVDAEVELGSAILLNTIGIDDRAPLPSDRTMGLLGGIRIAAPAFTRIAGRPVGIALEGAYVGLLADHAQTENLKDGSTATTDAILGSIELAYGLFPTASRLQLAVLASYHGAVQSTQYTGPSQRIDAANGNATTGERTQSLHASALGLRLSL